MLLEQAKEKDLQVLLKDMDNNVDLQLMVQIIIVDLGHLEQCFQKEY